METFRLDGSRWVSRDDFYDALFQQLGAPSWHGRNFNALRDSLVTGDINEREPPFRLVISGLDSMGQDAREITGHFIDLMLECREELEALGRRIDVQVV